MAEGFFLSEQDRAALTRILSRERSGQFEPEGHRLPVGGFADEYFPGDIHIAYVEEGGIPARNGLTPGSALCPIYRVAAGLLEQSARHDQTVYNLGGQPVEAGQFISVERDKFGSWFTQGCVYCGELGVDTGTGTGTALFPPEGPSAAGYCELAALDLDDAVEATGPTNVVILRYAGGGHWTSAEELEYPGASVGTAVASGPLDLWFENGILHLKLDGLELLNCGDGCWSGGPLTGHIPSSANTGTGTGVSVACSGPTFTVCLACVCDPIAGWAGPGWYCVNPAETTGTGTKSSDCSSEYLTEADRCNDLIVICSGPYDSQAAADLVCGGGTIDNDCCPGVLLPETLTVTLTNKTGDCTCLPDSFTITWNAGTENWESDPFSETCFGTPTFQLSCAPGGAACSGFRFSSTVCQIIQDTPEAGCSCDPISLVFQANMMSCCTGSATFTITE